MLLRSLIGVGSPELAARLEHALRDGNVRPQVLGATEDLWDRLTREDVDLLVVSRDVLGEEPRTLLDAIAKLPTRPGVIVVAHEENALDRARLLAAGGLAVLWEGLSSDALTEALRSFTRRRREETLQTLKAERPDEQYRLEDFVAESAVMRRFMDTVRQIVQSDTTSVLIAGETGAGKERLARAIHAEGRRASGPFIAVNCGALPEHLLESELFGHEEGAFTGAVRSRRGYFELAHRGTLFLDEIGEMPLHLQVKLLRVLEERRFYRVGGESPTAVDVRIVAATNRDLDDAVGKKSFRADLYYRLAVVTLEIPPLRVRRDDIPRLVASYLEHFKRQLSRRDLSIDPAAQQALEQYDWPGNVRELINVIERAVLLARGSAISPEQLPVQIARPGARSGDGERDGATFPDAWFSAPLESGRQRLVRAFERRYLDRVLRDAGGRVGEAARRAGVTERTLYELMKKHELRKEDFRRDASV